MDIEKLRQPELYDENVLYESGRVVIDDNVVYECLADNVNKKPKDYIGRYWNFIYINISPDVWITDNYDRYYLLKDSTVTMKIKGYNFDSNLIPSIDNCTVSNITLLSPTELQFDVTTPSDLYNDLQLKFNRETKGQVVYIDILDEVVGTGPAGEFLTDFNSGNSAAELWPNWDLAVYGNINSTDDFFKAGTSTPSSNTGASSSTPGFDGNFGYCETSNPNNGVGQYGVVETSYFRALDSIQFSYHMYGSDMGDLILESRNQDGSWTERFRLNGQQQSAQTDSFIDTGVIDASTWACDRIRITFTNIDGYRSDFCYDNIKLKSH